VTAELSEARNGRVVWTDRLRSATSFSPKAN
jgi:hypothetical protein